VNASALTAARDVLVDATGAVQATSVSAGRDVGVRSTGAGVALGQASAGDDLVLRAAGDIQVTGALAAGGAADGDGAADALFSHDPTSLTAAFDLAGSNVDVKSAGGAIHVADVSAARDVRLQTTGAGDVQVNSVLGGRDVLLDGAAVTAASTITATSGDVALRGRSGDVTANGAINAGDDVVVRASGAVKLQAVTMTAGSRSTGGAGDSLISVTEAIAASLDATQPAAALTGRAVDIVAGGNIAVGGPITRSAPDIAYGVRIQTPGDLALGSITAGDLVFVRARKLTLTVPSSWLVDNTVQIELTNDAGVSLGDAVGGAQLNQATIDSLNAKVVRIFAGDTSAPASTAGAVNIGALTIDPAKIRSRLEIYGGKDVTISGLFAPSVNAPGLTLQIGAANGGSWTPESVRIIADNGGAIGYADGLTPRTGLRAFGGVELNATGGIFAGYQSAIDKVEAAAPNDVPALVKTFVAPRREGKPAVLIAANQLTLRGGRIFQQDTSQTADPTRTGIYVGAGGLLLGRTTQSAAGGAALPDLIELSGVIDNGSVVLTNESAALSNLVTLGDGVRPKQNYRLNTCVILQQGNCTAQGGTPDTGVRPSLTLLQLLEQQGSGASEDPTAASATNEEIWRDPE
jgi:hypothetical protein